MTPVKFAEIKQQITDAKKRSDMAEGAKQKIEENWLKEFEVNSLEEAKSKINDMEKEISNDKEKLEKMYSKLEASAEWNSL
jgi:hypothetical protein